MKLKQVKLVGFKSFCDETELEFRENGITLIVGPNGCGKSNVADAIRWVLGEQSPRFLRGSSMGDVIFAGSATRKPIGRSEVTILFDNRDGQGLEKYREFSEVSVTRRLYRTGESEYLINNMTCRLLDVKELLMDTGVAGRSYSIVEQGKVEEFITATPQERRSFMEEAAGVMRFKTRRIAAEKKLESTRQNMLRVQDVVAELQQRETTLREQTEKANAYIALQDRVTALSAELARLRYARSAALCRQLEAALQAATAEALAVEQEVAKLSTDLDTHVVEQEQRQKDLQGRRSDAYRREQEIQKGESRRLVLATQQKNLADWLANLGTTEAELNGKLQSATEQRTALAAEEAEARQLAETVGQAIATDKASADERIAAAEARAAEVRKTQEALFEAAAKLTGARNQVALLGDRIAEDERRQAGMSAQLAASREALTHADATLIANRAREEESGIALATLDKLVEELSGLIRVRSEAVQEHRKRSSATERAVLEAAARLKTLRDIEAAYQGYGESVRTFMGFVAADPALRSEWGVVGPLAELIRTPGTLVDWAGGYLAPYLDVIVVKEAGVLARLETYLSQAGVGGLRFVALDALPASNGLSGGCLSSEVAFDEEVKALGEALFGAVRLLPAGTAPHPVPEPGAEPPGEWLARDGRFAVDGRRIVTLGRDGTPSLGILERRGEIEALQIQLEALERDLARLRQEETELAAEAQGLELRRVELDRQRGEASVAVKHAEADTAASERETNRLRSVLAQQEEEGTRMAQELARFRAQQAEAEREVVAVAVQEQQLQAAFPQLQADADSAKAESDQAGARLTQRRMEYERLKTRLDDHQRRVGELAAAEAELLAKQADIQAEVGQRRQQLAETDQELSALIPALAELQAELDRQRAAVREAAEAFDAQEQRGRALESQIRASRQELETRQGRVYEVDKKLTQERMRLEQWQAQLPPGLVPPEGAEGVVGDVGSAELGSPSGRDERELDRALSTAQAELKEMGAVNLAAPEEYAQLTTRLGFLTTEKADLDRAIQDLETSIRKMNQESRRRFKETFDKVNEQFQALFPRVFGGGEARLVLTDSDDPLLAGVDIVAQPPGKKLQSLNLLSGGEKALTAISLIFSFFLIKPSPFCLLDEVDAPLDDVNVGRFNRLIQSMTGQSQFIIITHNKRTMEIGDLLYGVTMEEAGVSKIVSVNLAGTPA